MPAHTPATAVCSTTSSPLAVAEVRHCTELEQLTEPWNRLLSVNPALGLFATPEWLISWWKAYGNRKNLLTLVFTDANGQVLGLAPLYLQRSKSLLRPLVLRLIGDGSGDSDDLDFVVHPGHEPAVLRAFMGWARTRRFDVCELNCVSPRSLVARLLLEELKVNGWTHASHERPSLAVALPETWELYLKQLSSKERGKVGYFLRRLEARKRVVRFHKCETIDALPNALDTLFMLHQKRWETRGEPGSFSLPARRHFYQEMTRKLLLRGWLELWFMHLDDQPVAAQIGLRYGDTIYALQEGFDPAYSSDSVGYVLRSHVLRESIAAGVRKYEFLAGDEQSKRRWGGDTGSYIDVHFARPASMGALYLWSAERQRAAKDWLRRHLPARALKAVQAIRNSPKQEPSRSGV